MFCINCGNKLSDDARFCTQCGARVSGTNSTSIETQPSVINTSGSLVPAKCTNCGGALQVNPGTTSALCPYCNTTFLVQQAINNYNISVNSASMNIANATINVNGMNANNLLNRAKDFENRGDLETALEYYNKVLDLDFTCQEGRLGIERVKLKLVNYVYYECEANQVFSSGKLQIRKGALVYVSKNGSEERYEFSGIRNLRRNMGCLAFDYPGKWGEVSFGCMHKDEIMPLILNAQNGIYPKIGKKY